MNGIRINFQSQHTNTLQIQLDEQKTVVQLVNLFDKRRYLTQRCLLDASLYFARKLHIGVVLDFRRNDRRRNRLGCIDNLHDTRNSLGDVHRSDAGEMESLERHLGSRFADTLCGQSTDGSARLGDCPIVLVASLRWK